MEIDFCTDEMTKSQRSQYIFRFKKVVKEREVQRQSRYSFHLLRLLCVHQVCSEERKDTEQKDLIVSAEVQKTLRHTSKRIWLLAQIESWRSRWFLPSSNVSSSAELNTCA